MDTVVYQYLNGASTSTVVLNSKSFNPQQIAIFKLADNTGIWFRENGNFYCCLDASACYKQNFPYFTVNEGETITDFSNFFAFLFVNTIILIDSFYFYKQVQVMVRIYTTLIHHCLLLSM